MVVFRFKKFAIENESLIISNFGQKFYNLKLKALIVEQLKELEI